MGNVLSYLFPKPAPASIEQVVEVSEDVAKTMEATTQDLNETVAADIDDLVVENTMAEAETIESIQESNVNILDATISEPIGVSPLFNIQTSSEPFEGSSPEPVNSPTLQLEVEVVGKIEENKTQNDKEDTSGGVDGLRDVLQAATFEPQKTSTPEPNPTPEPIKLSTPGLIISPTPEPEVEVIGTIEENKTQNDEEDVTGDVDGLKDVVQAATPEARNTPTPESNPTPEPKDYTPEPVKSHTPEPPKAPTPEPTLIPASFKVSTPEPVKTLTPEPVVEVVAKIEENKEKNDEEDMSGGLDGLRDVLQAASPELPKSSTFTPEPKVSSPEPVTSPTPEPLKVPTPEATPIPDSINVPVKTPTPEPKVEIIGTIEENKAHEEDDTPGHEASTPEPIQTPSYEPIKLSTSENENVRSPESIIDTTTNAINDKEEVSGGAAGLRDDL